MVCGHVKWPVWRKYGFWLHEQKSAVSRFRDRLVDIASGASRAGDSEGFSKESGTESHKGILDRGGKNLMELCAARQEPDQAGCRIGSLGRNAGLSQVSLYRLYRRTLHQSIAATGMDGNPRATDPGGGGGDHQGSFS